MKRFGQQLHSKAQRITMRASERRELRERLVSYMEYHPLSKTTSEKHAEAYISSERFSLINFNTSHARGFFGAFAVFVLIIVPIVAERAVPGDVLYPVKVNFNEEIRSTLAVSPYAKVEWETQRLERRIAEARLLAREGKLTDEIGEGVAAAVKLHSDAAQQGIAALRESDSEEAAIAEITFASALTVQSEMLEGALEKEVAEGAKASTTPGSSVATLAGIVEQTRKDAEEKQSGIAPSYETLSGKLESETTRAYELFESVKEYANAEEIIDIERRLSDIGRKIAEALEVHDADLGDEDVSEIVPEAAILRTALSDLQKLISFMTDIDVRENVGIEELVPVSLTDEERTQALIRMQEEIDVTLSDISDRVAVSSLEKAVEEKMLLGILQATASASTSKAALLQGALTRAETSAANATLIIGDLENLIKSYEGNSLSEEAKSTDGIDTEIEKEKASSTEVEILEEEVQSTTTEVGV